MEKKDSEYVKNFIETAKKMGGLNEKNNPVSHPSHYTSGKIEVIDFITDQKLDFCLGNVVKYISRAGKKTEVGKDDYIKMIEDLEKAQFYLNFKIKELKENSPL